MQRYFFLPSVNSGFCFSSKAHGRREVICSRLTEAVPRSMFIGHPKWQSVRYQALDRSWLMFPLLVKEKIPYENWPLEKRPVKITEEKVRTLVSRNDHQWDSVSSSHPPSRPLYMAALPAMHTPMQPVCHHTSRHDSSQKHHSEWVQHPTEDTPT